ncbi:hypothetical protein GCM10007977_020930 [Dactylosporangium sucinum]|uniref:Uncharacterized protein n=1 Tax=Dactylosporangium sucinum TaxID=1424081 RepID=A0A917TE41_9ACTN|nr:hypothetical protein GCM10007977_020930 [Dactylosporangium sucinum]
MSLRSNRFRTQRHGLTSAGVTLRANSKIDGGAQTFGHPGCTNRFRIMARPSAAPSATTATEDVDQRVPEGAARMIADVPVSKTNHKRPRSCTGSVRQQRLPGATRARERVLDPSCSSRPQP